MEQNFIDESTKKSDSGASGRFSKKIVSFLLHTYIFLDKVELELQIQQDKAPTGLVLYQNYRGEQQTLIFIYLKTCLKKTWNNYFQQRYSVVYRQLTTAAKPSMITVMLCNGRLTCRTKYQPFIQTILSVKLFLLMIKNQLLLNGSMRSRPMTTVLPKSSKKDWQREGLAKFRQRL